MGRSVCELWTRTIGFYPSHDKEIKEMKGIEERQTAHLGPLQRARARTHTHTPRHCQYEVLGTSDMQRPSPGWFLDLNEVCSDPWGPSGEVPRRPASTTKACQLKMQGSRQEMATPSAFWPPGECQTCKGLHPVGSWTRGPLGASGGGDIFSRIFLTPSGHVLEPIGTVLGDIFFGNFFDAFYIFPTAFGFYIFFSAPQGKTFHRMPLKTANNRKGRDHPLRM